MLCAAPQHEGVRTGLGSRRTSVRGYGKSARAARVTAVDAQARQHDEHGRLPGVRVKGLAQVLHALPERPGVQPAVCHAPS